MIFKHACYIHVSFTSKTSFNFYFSHFRQKPTCEARSVSLIKFFWESYSWETRNTGTFSERTGLLISNGTIYSSSETFSSPIFIGIVFSVFYVCKSFISITLRIRAEIMTTIILLLFGRRLWSIKLLRFASVNIYMQLITRVLQ